MEKHSMLATYFEHPGLWDEVFGNNDTRPRYKNF